MTDKAMQLSSYRSYRYSQNADGVLVALLIFCTVLFTASAEGEMTQLHHAAVNGDLDLARSLVQVSGSDVVNALGPGGATPLHVAVQHNRLSIIELLVMNRADVDATMDSVVTPLLFAAQLGHVRVAAVLVENGARLGAALQSGSTALHLAAKAGNLDLVNVILAQGGGEAAKLTTRTGITPLHVAAENGRAHVARALIEVGGAELMNARTEREGQTPLHTAARKERLDVLRLLLNGRAALHATNSEGGTPLHIATQHGKRETLDVLLQAAHADDALAAMEARMAPDGHTPLQLAARYGRFEIARLLLKSGAPVDDRDAHGSNALRIAAQYGKHEILRLLIMTGGAAVDARGNDGSTVLHIAASYNQIAVAEFLLKSNVTDIDAQTNMGETALHLAARLGLPEMAKLLLFHGAEVDEPTPQGCTPLYMAVYTMVNSLTSDQFLQLISVLLEAGASPTAQTRMGTSAMHVAAYFNLEAVAMLFRRHGADQDAVFLEQSQSGQLRNLRMQAVGKGGAPCKASSLDELLASPDDFEHAVHIWRCNGVVVFPGLIPQDEATALEIDVDVLKTRNLSDTITASIRSPAFRLMRPIAISQSGEVVSLLAERLHSFLAAALQNSKQLLLESTFWVTEPGAQAQDWHADTPAFDERIAKVQVALVDTESTQGVLEVKPGTHLRSAGSSARASAIANAGTVAIATRAGSVTLYSPHLLHRGSSNNVSNERVHLTYTIIGESGLLAPGIVYKMQPQDSWRFWFNNGTLSDVAHQYGKEECLT